MVASKPVCVLCSKKSVALRLFTIETLEKCKKVLRIRQENQLCMSKVNLPEVVSPTALYHSQCYKLFTALPKKHRAAISDEPLLELSTCPSWTSTSCSSPEPSLCNTLSPEGGYKEETISEPIDEEISKGGPVAHTLKTCIICNRRRKKSKGREQTLLTSGESSITILKDYAQTFPDYDLLARLYEKESAGEIIMHHQLCLLFTRNQLKSIKADDHKFAYGDVMKEDSLMDSRDEYSVFGEYLAKKVRECNRPWVEVCLAQRYINDILFRLDMGLLAAEIPCIQTPSTSISSHSPSSNVSQDSHCRSMLTADDMELLGHVQLQQLESKD